MLARPDEQQVIEALRAVMSQSGFQRREGTWYRFSPETVQVFDVQAATSPSSQRVYFNLGVAFREAHPLTHLRVFDCPVYGRLDHVIPDAEAFPTVTDFGHSDVSHDQRLARIVDFIQRFALPVLDSWQTKAGVTVFIESERSRGFSVRQTQRLDDESG
jgi:hypothetical protein